MTLKEYLENLNKLLKERPELSELKVITSRDDEGNGFNEVSFTPSIGYYEDGEFRQEQKPNVICVN